MVGRKKEIDGLIEVYESEQAEFVAVYGRIGIGKTYLVDNVFKNKFTFRHAGLSPLEMKSCEFKSPLKNQLTAFYKTMLKYGLKSVECPSSWMDAFFLLECLLEEKDDGTRQLVFLDELPWMDTPKSGFMTAFEYFWNNWGCHRDNFMLIVCGSANSWILNKLMNNHGGLYGRLTHEIRLSPFTLGECEEFFRQKRVSLSRYDITQSYMIFGGIPYYLGMFRKGLSLAQNVDSLLFSHAAVLRDEFKRLFSSIFDNSERAEAVVRMLNTRSSGFTANEISQKTGIGNGGALSALLSSLVASDFVIKYVPFGFSKREIHYKLVDPFCLFYLRFVENMDSLNEDFWQQNLVSQAVVVWRGLSFENVCFLHINQIKKALGISGVITTQSAWSKREGDEQGTQIDLLIERRDDVVNMCEIKFYSDDFTVDKSYYRTVIRRQGLLEKYLKRKNVIHNTLITTYGLTYNEYSGVFTNVITLDDLFD